VNLKVKIKKSKLPFVFSNFAMTADGKIAFADHSFAPFSSKRDNEHIFKLRATADAIICGARTIEETDTILGPGGKKFRRQRLKNGLLEFPLRIVVSGSGSIEPGTKIFQKKISPVIVLVSQKISESKLKKLRATADEVKIFGKSGIDFCAALQWLRQKWKIKRLLCEGGGELHSALMRADLIDELHLTICPKIFGGRQTPTIADGEGFDFLTDARKFRLKRAKRVGSELFTVFTR
jgi:riboflavin-specific deaminase-like protein